MLSFDELPNAVSLLTREICDLKKIILERDEQEQTDSTEKLLTVKEASEFLNLTVKTIYSKVSKGELPYMKQSKKLYFSSTELMEYLKAGRRKTDSEIDAETDEFLSTKKGLKNGK